MRTRRDEGTRRVRGRALAAAAAVGAVGPVGPVRPASADDGLASSAAAGLELGGVAVLALSAAFDPGDRPRPTYQVIMFALTPVATMGGALALASASRPGPRPGNAVHGALYLGGAGAVVGWLLDHADGENTGAGRHTITLGAAGLAAGAVVGAVLVPADRSPVPWLLAPQLGVMGATAVTGMAALLAPRTVPVRAIAFSAAGGAVAGVAAGLLLARRGGRDGSVSMAVLPSSTCLTLSGEF